MQPRATPWGGTPEIPQALKGRKKRRPSIPNVALIILDAVPPEKPPKLLLEINGLMVILLILDVSLYRGHVRLAHGGDGYKLYRFSALVGRNITVRADVLGEFYQHLQAIRCARL